MQKSGGRVNVIVKILVFVHLFAILSWSLPNPANAILNRKVPPRGNEVLLLANYDKLKMNPALRAYVFATGGWQYWDMFAPNPASVDVWGDAEVIRSDGKSEIYKYPRINDLPIPQKYLNERYRKYFERVSSDEYAYTWPAFSAQVARLMDTDPNNRPVKIKLRRHRQLIPPMGDFARHPYSVEEFFEYDVKPEDLRK